MGEQHTCNEEKDKNCIGNYNKTLMDPIEDYARFTVQALIIIGALMDIICMKWRHIADWLLYHECLIRSVALLIRNWYSWEQTAIDITMMFVVVYFGQYCDSGWQIICLSSALAF